MRKRKRVLVDLDNITVDLTKKWLDLYNRDFGDTLTVADITSWHIANHVKCSQEEMHEYLYSDRFFLDVEPMPGAIEALKEIHDAVDAEGKPRFHLLIVSAPSHPGNSATDKITWVRERMPWFNKRDISLMHHKHMLDGDWLVDDSPDNIRAYRAERPTAKIATIAYPFNREVRQLCDVFAESYWQSAQAWREIVSSIMRS